MLQTTDLCHDAMSDSNILAMARVELDPISRGSDPYLAGRLNSVAQ